MNLPPFIQLGAVAALHYLMLHGVRLQLRTLNHDWEILAVLKPKPFKNVAPVTSVMPRDEQLMFYVWCETLLVLLLWINWFGFHEAKVSNYPDLGQVQSQPLPSKIF